MGKVLSVFKSPRMFIALILGMASGFPLALSLGTLQAWMKDEKVDLKTIGLFAFVHLPYVYKFAWAPLMDRWVPPFLGRRRGWMLISQIGMIIFTVALSFSQPAQAPFTVALWALGLVFFSASQDIVIDAFRIEYFKNEEYGPSTGIHVMGYKLGLMVSGGFALIIADGLPWKTVYLIMALIMGLTMLVTFVVREPKSVPRPPKNFREMVVDPFVEFFSRRGAMEILLFTFLYKIGDVMASALKTPFLMEMGYEKIQIGAVAKLFSLWATIGGTALGGIILASWSLRRALFIFGLFQAISTFVYYLLTTLPPTYGALAACVTIEDVSGGMGTAAYTTFLMYLCNKKFTATQFALLSSIMATTRIFGQAPVGYIVEAFGWRPFFVGCIVLGLVPLLLLKRYPVWEKSMQK